MTSSEPAHLTPDTVRVDQVYGHYMGGEPGPVTFAFHPERQVVSAQGQHAGFWDLLEDGKVKYTRPSTPDTTSTFRVERDPAGYVTTMVCVASTGTLPLKGTLTRYRLDPPAAPAGRVTGRFIAELDPGGDQ